MFKETEESLDQFLKCKMTANIKNVETCSPANELLHTDTDRSEDQHANVFIKRGRDLPTGSNPNPNPCAGQDRLCSSCMFCLRITCGIRSLNISRMKQVLTNSSE